MLDDIRQMVIFAKTIEHGSFRAAAKSLRLSPAVISQQVAQLEKRLGTVLIYRTTRKLTLTEDGKQLLKSAQAITDLADVGIHSIGNQQQEKLAGTLRVTAPAVLARSQLTDNIGKFAIAHPNVQLNVDYSDTVKDLIGDGYDVAIRVGDLPDSSLIARKLFEIERCLVASPSYIEQQKTIVSPNDLSEWDWLELSPVWQEKIILNNGAESISISRGKFIVSTNNAIALAQLARSGAGLVMLPEFLVTEDIESGRLSKVIEDWSIPVLRISALWPSNVVKDGLIQHFVKFLVKGN